MSAGSGQVHLLPPELRLFRQDIGGVITVRIQRSIGLRIDILLIPVDQLMP
jgi:hypothetical protein